MDGQTTEFENARYFAVVRGAFRANPTFRARRWAWLAVAVVLGLIYGWWSGPLGDLVLGRLPPAWAGWLGLPVWMAGLLLVMLLVLVVYRRLGPPRRRRRLAAKAYRRPDSVAVLERVEAELADRYPGIPDADAHLAHNRARVALFYGEVAGARESLNRIAWEERAPVIHAAGLEDEACFALLCTGEVSRGLELARRALALAAMPPRGGRPSRARGGPAVMVALGEVLCGEATPETLARLRIMARRGPDHGTRALADRALYVAYHRAGDAKRAARQRRRLERLVPHCAPLVANPDGPPADASWTRDPGPPSRALLANAWPGPPEGAPAPVPQRSRLRRWLPLLFFFVVLEVVYHFVWR